MSNYKALVPKYIKVNIATIKSQIPFGEKIKVLTQRSRARFYQNLQEDSMKKLKFRNMIDQINEEYNKKFNEMRNEMEKKVDNEIACYLKEEGMM